MIILKIKSTGKRIILETPRIKIQYPRKTAIEIISEKIKNSQHVQTKQNGENLHKTQ